MEQVTLVPAANRVKRRRIAWIAMILAAPLLIYGGIVTVLAVSGARSLRADDAARAVGQLRRAALFAPWSSELAFSSAVAARRAGDPDRFLEYAELARRRGCLEVRIAWQRELLDAQSGQLHKPSGFAVGHSIESHLRQIIRGQTENEVAAREALSKGLIQSFRLSEAVAELDAWIARFPDSFHARVWAGEVLSRVRRNRDAVDVLRASVALRPASPLAQSRLADALYANGQAAESLALLRGPILSAETDAASLTLMGRCLIDQGEMREARQTLLRAHELAPDFPLNLALIAQIELADGAAEEALRWAERAVAIGPREQIPNYVLAQSLTRLNRPEEATAAQARVAEIRKDWDDFDTAQLQALNEPRNPNPRLTIGLILSRNLHPQQGIRWILTALAIDPNHQACHEALAELYAQAGDTRQAEQHRAISRQLAARHDNTNTETP